MKRSLRRALATLTLTATATIGTAVIDAVLAPADTAWGAPDTTTPTAPTVDTGTLPDITPLDTAWG